VELILINNNKVANSSKNITYEERRKNDMHVYSVQFEVWN